MRAQRGHLAFLQRKLTGQIDSDPDWSKRNAKVLAEIEAAQVELANRQAVESRVRAEAARDRQMALFP